MPPRIAYATTVKDRTRHLRITLPQNLADNPQALFVVLNYGTGDDLLAYLDAEHRLDIESGRLVLYSHLDTPTFRMAHAKNMAHRLGIREGADILVNLDADNRTNTGFDGYLQRQFTRHGPGMFMSAHMIKGKLPRGINGRIATTKDAFLRSGGYDEVLFEGGWSSEDKHYVLRLRKLGYRDIHIPAFYLDAILHNDKIRFAQYPEMAKIAGNLDIRAKTIGDAVSNSGSVGCGRVFRNWDFDTPILVEPTEAQETRPRVWGIGLHKTATTSLHEALRLLGYTSWHWSSVGSLPPAHAARDIWRGMRTGRSPLLDRFQAACDIPIPLLYRQLDVAYPGSRFVLTVRDERIWLKSVMWHFYEERPNWGQCPFTDVLHRQLYGRTGFDADVFIERYRQHNLQVRRYFANRPGDLLIMDMDHGAGWKELCGFLGVDEPSTAYPMANGST